jgi:hypothetical protein
VEFELEQFTNHALQYCYLPRTGDAYVGERSVVAVMMLLVTVQVQVQYQF